MMPGRKSPIPCRVCATEADFDYSGYSDKGLQSALALWRIELGTSSVGRDDYEPGDSASGLRQDRELARLKLAAIKAEIARRQAQENHNADPEV